MKQFLKSKLITYIEGNHTKEEVLSILVNTMKNAGFLSKDENFLEKILEREQLGSTGIGQQIAIPHTRCETLKEFVIAIGLLENKISFNSPDGEKVKLVIMIAAPKGMNKEYLSLVAQVTRIFRNEKTRNSVLSARNYQELLESLAEI